MPFLRRSTDEAPAPRAAPSTGRPGPGRVAPLGDADVLEHRFLDLAMVARWAFLVVGLAIALSRRPIEGADLVAGALIGAWALVLLLRPHRFDDRDPIWWAIVAVDLAIAVTAVAPTEGESSPYLLSPLVPLALLAFTAGRREIVGLVVAAVATVATVMVIAMVPPEPPEAPMLLAVVYLAAGVVGGFARRTALLMRERESATEREVARLAAANDLLQALHAVAQTLPSSFDLEEVVGSVRDRLRDQLQPHVVVLMVRDDATRGWRTELADGARVPALFTDSDLPPSLALALTGRRVVVAGDGLGGAGGLSSFSRSALYVPLVARDEQIGLLAVEHGDARRYGPEDARWIAELAGPLALALDNARWFRRLRRFGAEAERARIARDLHDRLAQSLAYVAFELERLGDADPPDRAAVAELQHVVRQVVGELRETLYELRVKVTEERSIAEVAGEFCRRVERRSGMRVTFTSRGERRLSLPVEQELWLILQEAVLNAERHSGAEHVAVSWEIGERTARLEVRDAGHGFDPARGRRDHFGLLGMRERAEAIGARLTITSAPGAGTAIEVALALHPEPA
jgi:signal transduction histidine kinase